MKLSPYFCLRNHRRWGLGMVLSLYAMSSSGLETNAGRSFTEHMQLNSSLLIMLLLLLCVWLGYRLMTSRLEILNLKVIDFHALADNAHDGIFIVQNEQLVYANQRATDILGYDDDELPGRGLADIVHADDTELLLDRHRRRMRGEDAPKLYEVTLCNKHGSRVPVELTAALTTWQGSPAALVIIRDITERKLIEKTLLDSEKRYRSLVENSPDAILIIDAERNSIIEANEQAELLFKLSKQDLFAIDPEQLSRSTTDHSRQKPLTHYIERALHGVPLIFEREFHDSTGQAISCEIRLSRMPFPNRRLVRCSVIDISQRKLYQSALARSEERLASFFQASFETLLFHDQGIVLDVNNMVEQMFGYSREEFIGRHVLEFVAPESQQIARENMRKGEQGPYELKALRKDGHTFPVQIRARTLHQDDTFRRIVAVADISNLQHANDKLRASEQNLQHIIDNMIDTFYRVDMQGKLTMVSPSVTALLGYQPDELLGSELATLYLDPYGREFFMSSLKNNHGQITAYQTPLLHKNGDIVWVSTNAKFIYDKHGEITGVEGVSRNITQQRNNEQALLKTRDELEVRVQQRTEQLSQKIQELEALQLALRDSEQNFRALFDGAVDSFLLHDDKGQILDVNRQTCDFLGYERDELLKMTVDDIDVGPAPVSLQTLLNTLQEQASVTIESIQRHKDGSTIPVEVRLGLLHKGSEKLFLALVRDITTRKAAEHQLISDRDQAKHASQAKSEFLSRMSHELRTPLNAIIGFSDLLASDAQNPLPPPHQENVDEIVKAGRHLLNLIDDLLEVSAIETGRIKILPIKTNVCAISHACITMLRPLAQHKAIRFQHNLDELTAVYINADPTRLKQIIINLLSNAIKYNNAGSLISLELTTDATAMRLSLSDNGPGLTKAQQKRLFLPFERIYDYPDIEGTGIGLNICKHLTELMNGRIGVNSKYRSGSQFWLEFPLAIESTVSIDDQETVDLG